MEYSSAQSSPISTGNSSAVSPTRIMFRQEIRDQEMGYSQTGYSPSRSNSSYTFDEAEVETNIYFPTFARRSSIIRNPRRPYSSHILPQVSVAKEIEQDEIEDWTPRKSNYSKKTSKDHDDIFELDDEADDLDQIAIGFSNFSLRDYSETSRRRTSDQSSSSADTGNPTHDLNMVWDEEYHEGDSSISRPPPPPKVVRQGSLSGSISQHTSTSPKWTRPVESIIPSLPFARQVRRPSDSLMSPPAYQWRSYKGSKTISRNNSVRTGGIHDKRSPTVPTSPLEILSSPNSPKSTATMTKSPPTSAPLVENNPEPLLIMGRKRSSTDPFSGGTFLKQIGSFEPKSEKVHISQPKVSRSSTLLV